MPRINHMATHWQEPAIGVDVPRLPFLTRAADTPACIDHADTFARAGDLDRLAVASDQAKTRTEQAERHARSVCATCPVLPGCRAYALETRQRWGVWGGTTAAEREEWIKLHPKRIHGEGMPDRFADIPTIPLFDDTPHRVAPDRPKSIKSVGQGNCPNCLREKTGVVPTGDHWVWRQHYFQTWGGDTRLCSTSGVAVCLAPEPAGKEFAIGHPLHCPHGREPLDQGAA